MKNIVVLYHDDCPDGFGAAFAAWKKFGGKAEYIATGYDDKPHLELKNKTIYLLDFSYASNIIKKLVAQNKRVIAIDHHISRKEDIKSASEWHYADKHSGATLSWLTLHPKKPIPKLLNYVEDVDLWKMKLPHTDAIISVVGVTKWTFKEWDKLAKNLEHPKTFKKHLEHAHWIIKANRKIKERIIKNAELVEFQGYKTYAVNSPVFNSELGHSLYEKLPPIAIIWKEGHNKNYVSLRSDGTVDVSKLAKKFGGGGHKASAAFFIDAEKPHPWKNLE